MSVYSITIRNNASISNFGGGFRWQSEYPWCIIGVKSKERSNEHNSRSTRSSTSGIDRHLVLHRCKKTVSFKVKPYRKSWDNKIDLVRDQLYGEYSNRNGASKNNNARRRFLIDDYKVAKALHNTSYKIQRDDQELIIIMLPYSPPRGAISPTVSDDRITLNKLDNLELPSQYSPIESKFKMPISLGNCYPIIEGHNPELPNSVTSLAELFLTQYYERYDNQMSREKLSEAYHENATFTLSSSLLFKNVNGSISENLLENSNFLKTSRQKYENHQYLHRGKENITNFLDILPKTKHYHGSFVVDVPLANAAMVQIVLNGVFYEDFKETNDKHVFRSFCRTFCIVPVGNGWSILSDIFFITTVTKLESSKRFQAYKQKPNDVAHSTSASLTINQLSTEAPMNVTNDDDSDYNKMSMVKRFSNESKMNSKWAEKCLEENEWDYSEAWFTHSRRVDRMESTKHLNIMQTGPNKQYRQVVREFRFDNSGRSHTSDQ
ncbi:Uncharacterized protein FWK35_00007315 [Aphis craccivora]|uniref:NTF2 domain-containing protein n=1 Tax=Aphis craccivora TaxID=307492 RepID=A0A6G0ZEW2_APHCR|nr:Uncharacterized protein FWK35_00007315 [Aphis craccivora]